MEIGKSKDEVVMESPQKSDEGKMELYLYSLRKLAEQNVKSNVNDLTKLNNLKAFFFLSGEMIREYPENRYAVIVMDIAQFKAVNEFCGRSAGDNLLRYIAQLYSDLEKNRAYTIVCHVRADIFCLCTAYEEKQELVDIVNQLGDAIDTYDIAYKVLPAFGICESVEEHPAVSYLKDCATMALQEIKGKFFARYIFFDDKMRQQQMREKQIENDIVEALKNKNFVLYIQPKVDMDSGRVIGGEALVRWLHPQKGIISPAEFVPVLEKNGFIINVDVYVWEEVFRFLGQLMEEGIQPVPVSINVSRVHAYDKEFCRTLCDLRDKYNVPPPYVPLELTESAFLADEEGMYNRLKFLRAQGFKVSMDDFGTGYSTMNMLKNQPMDEIKIDRAFITDMDNPKSKVIIRHTINMLKDLDTSIIVEGVEKKEQQDFLLECGCQKAQGYLYYRPMPVREFEKLVRKQQDHILGAGNSGGANDPDIPDIGTV